MTESATTESQSDESPAAGSVPAGRPRDPGVDERVTAAAVELFGETGWSGFSIEAVARRSGVGKASIYLRWRSKDQLLVDALTGQLDLMTQVDTGSVRTDLEQLARQLLDLYLGPTGRAALRLGVEPPQNPAISRHFAALTQSQVLAARAVVRRGINRGELRPDVSVTMLLDTLCGGAMMHAMATPATLRDTARDKAPEYAEQLVEFLLRSVEWGRGELGL